MTNPCNNNDFSIAEHQKDNAVIVSIVGSVTTDKADELRKRLEQIAAKQPPIIVLDISKMDFICSAGLGAIIIGYLKCRHHKGQVRIASPSAKIRELLETTRLDKLLDVFDTVEDALKG